MTVFLPTSSALVELSQALQFEPNEPAVTPVFEALMLGTNLKPWLSGWWQLDEPNKRLM